MSILDKIRSRLKTDSEAIKQDNPKETIEAVKSLFGKKEKEDKKEPECIQEQKAESSNEPSSIEIITIDGDLEEPKTLQKLIEEARERSGLDLEKPPRSRGMILDGF